VREARAIGARKIKGLRSISYTAGIEYVARSYKGRAHCTKAIIMCAPTGRVIGVKVFRGEAEHRPYGRGPSGTLVIVCDRDERGGASAPLGFRKVCNNGSDVVYSKLANQ
jgi:hypothetical protein